MLRASRGGFTLVEALVALLIASAVMIGTVEALAAGFRAQASASASLIAVALAETRMAELAALPFDSLPRDQDIRDGHFPPPFHDYRWHTIVQGVEGAPALRAVAVLVAWDGGEFSLETVLFRPYHSAAQRRPRASRP
jgi:hypothetical protein